MKTTNEYLSDVIKYAGPSAGVGFAVSEIIVFLFPEIASVGSAVAVLAMFIANLIMGVLKGEGIIYRE